MSDDDLIREAREAFELAADAEAENRREAMDDLKASCPTKTRSKTPARRSPPPTSITE